LFVRAKPGTWLGLVLSYGIGDQESWNTDFYDLEFEATHPSDSGPVVSVGARK
jgi:hypothetical protein